MRRSQTGHWKSQPSRRCDGRLGGASRPSLTPRSRQANKIARPDDDGGGNRRPAAQSYAEHGAERRPSSGAAAGAAVQRCSGAAEQQNSARGRTGAAGGRRGRWHGRRRRVGNAGVLQRRVRRRAATWSTFASHPSPAGSARAAPTHLQWSWHVLWPVRGRYGARDRDLQSY